MDTPIDINTLLDSSPSTLGIIGMLLVLSLLARILLKHSVFPSMLIFLGCGLLLEASNSYFGFLDSTTRGGLKLLSEAGLVLLLFKVGLESDIKGLREQLPKASWIWVWDVLVSGSLAYIGARYILDYSLLTSAFVAVALSATSLGVTVGFWQSAGSLNTAHGQLLTDVAELDDISSIALMAVLVAMAPVLVDGSALHWGMFGLSLAKVLFTLMAFALACWGFSVYLEARLTQYVLRHKTDHEPMVMILALAFIIAALADWSGLSLAIGAFLAGLAFSRDTQATKEHIVFEGLYDFFTPFFFIGLGLQIPLSAFATALGPGLLLVLLAIVGKLAGVGLPAWPKQGLRAAILIGVSMVPRAEITMVVMQKGLVYGVAPEAFAAILIVCAVTIIATAVGLPILLLKEGKDVK